MSLEQFQHHSESHSKSNEMVGSVVDLGNPRVQVELAKLQFPNDPEAMVKWLTPDESGISLAQRYGGLRDESGERVIDLSNNDEIRRVLGEVLQHIPDTLH